MQPAQFHKQTLVSATHGDAALHFTQDGWFNATEAAAKFGKRPVDWLKLESTKRYIAAVERSFNSGRVPGLGTSTANCEKSSQLELIVTRSGRHNSGTWLHPALAVVFARWLNVDFAIWCDTQIRQILAGQHPHHDWQKLRHETAASFKVMTSMLKLSREFSGKATAQHHYINEARVVNWALTGDFASVDRDALPSDELELLATLEEKNSVYIGRGLPYHDRKVLLKQAANDFRDHKLVQLGMVA